MPSIEVADAEAMVKLLATVGDPTVEMSLDHRKSELLQRLGALVDADAWIWATSRFNLQTRGDAMAVSLIDGGWINEQERVVILGLISKPDTSLPITATLHDAIIQGKSITLSRDQVLDDKSWLTEPVGKSWRAAGFDHVLISSYPVGKEHVSSIGFYRRLGKLAFSQRDRLIVHVMLQHIDWLHRAGSNVAASKKVVELSPRERQVTLLLMGGSSRKQVAAKLHLSQHTVADYLKEIYRKLGVSSRGELLAKFIPGGK